MTMNPSKYGNHLADQQDINYRMLEKKIAGEHEYVKSGLAYLDKNKQPKTENATWELVLEWEPEQPVTGLQNIYKIKTPGTYAFVYQGTLTNDDYYFARTPASPNSSTASFNSWFIPKLTNGFKFAILIDVTPITSDTLVLNGFAAGKNGTSLAAATTFVNDNYDNLVSIYASISTSTDFKAYVYKMK